MEKEIESCDFHEIGFYPRNEETKKKESRPVALLRGVIFERTGEEVFLEFSLLFLKYEGLIRLATKNFLGKGVFLDYA